MPSSEQAKVAPDANSENARNASSDSNRARSTICILLLLLGLQIMAVRIVSLPLNRMIELRYCWEYYTRYDPSKIEIGGKIPEKLCKIDIVQQRLAWMHGSIEMLHTLCGQSIKRYHTDTFG